MYFFVPYNISEIQKGIQAGHAALEYAEQYGLQDDYRDFIENNKTWIILNGGTTRSSPEYETSGTMNQILDDLRANNVHCQYFLEPDLNNALTAVCFLADERVWDLETYPDFDSNVYGKSWVLGTGAMSALQVCPEEIYQEWVKFVGGKKNVFLRTLIKDKRLA